jgi:hypothetical protein
MKNKKSNKMNEKNEISRTSCSEEMKGGNEK